MFSLANSALVCTQGYGIGQRDVEDWDNQYEEYVSRHVPNKPAAVLGEFLDDADMWVPVDGAYGPRAPLRRATPAHEGNVKRMLDAWQREFGDNPQQVHYRQASTGRSQNNPGMAWTPEDDAVMGEPVPKENIGRLLDEWEQEFGEDTGSQYHEPLSLAGEDWFPEADEPDRWLLVPHRQAPPPPVLRPAVAGVEDQVPDKRKWYARPFELPARWRRRLEDFLYM